MQFLPPYTIKYFSNKKFVIYKKTNANMQFQTQNNQFWANYAWPFFYNQILNPGPGSYCIRICIPSYTGYCNHLPEDYGTQAISQLSFSTQ